jgi:hypothetical protein
MIGTKSMCSANRTVITDSTLKKTVITEDAGQQGWINSIRKMPKL